MSVLSTLGRSATVIGGLNVVGFVITASTGTHRITDLTGTFAFTASVLATANIADIPLPAKLLTGAVILWATRLGTYLFTRIMHIDTDERLSGFFRKSDNEPWFTGPANFPLKLAGFWTMQALWGFIVLLPVTISQSILSSNLDLARQIFSKSPIRKLGFIGGLAIFASGFLIETMADLQKFKYKSQQTEKGLKSKWIETGLWKYSRHPNYFGELCCWWGLSLAGFSASFSTGLLPVPIVARAAIASSFLISPGFVTWLITSVSGVNLLEAKDDSRYGADPDYQKYKAKTNALVPKLF